MTLSPSNHVFRGEMRAIDVFCYGEIGVDNIIQVDGLPSPENAVFPSSDSYHIGGAALNTAVWLASLGIKVGLSGNVIGVDTNGDFISKKLMTHPNISSSFLERSEGVTTPFNRTLVTPNGDRSFLIYWYPKTPKTRLTREMLDGARFLALDLYGGAERLAAAKLAFENGVKTVIGDVIWPDHPTLPFTSVAINSGYLIRKNFPAVDVRQHSRMLQTISHGIIITTNGPHPVHAIDAQGKGYVITPPPVEAVDTTGAGDAFRSGLIYGLARGLDLPNSLRWAVAVGSLQVKSLGAATTLPPLTDIENLANSLQVVAEIG